jgi:hypothetical protein
MGLDREFKLTLTRRTFFSGPDLTDLFVTPAAPSRVIATNVLNGKKLSEALKDVEPGSVLDFNYYVAKVEPILATPGADGKACV